MKELFLLEGMEIPVKEIKKVVIEDRTDYVPGKSHTGGQYSYTTLYRNIGGRKFREECYSSAEFDYSISGDGFGSAGTIDDCRIIDVQALESRINRLSGVPDMLIDIFVGDEVIRNYD